MKRRYRRFLPVLATAIAVVAMLTACQNEEVEKPDSTLSPEALKTAEYPLETDEVLKLWMRHHVGAQVAGQPDYGKYPRMAEMEQKTGVSLSISYANNGQEEEEFNLLLASEELPDMIYYDWLHIPGGVDEAIRGGYITALNDLIAEYAPNYGAFLEEQPEYAKMARTDSGNYYMFNSYPVTKLSEEEDRKRSASSGFFIRKDWLDALRLEPPETISEWHTVLKAFKEKGVASPLTLNLSDEYALQGLIGAFGIGSGFYQENGRVIYGREQPEYRDFLSEMQKWYQEGILDEDILTINDERVHTKMRDGACGIAFGWIGANMERWIKEGKELDPNYEVIGLKPPTIQRGETSKFGNYYSPFSHIGVAVSASSDKKELAAKFLDYGYTGQGALLYNYGIEGVSYEMIEGKPEYKLPPDGMTRSDFLTFYTMSTGNWPYKDLTMDNSFFYSLPQQDQAVKAFCATEYADYLMPPISQTSEEAEEASRLELLISNYADEMMKKFILGREPLENFDLYIANLKEMGIDRLVELKQVALARYNRR